MRLISVKETKRCLAQMTPFHLVSQFVSELLQGMFAIGAIGFTSISLAQSVISGPIISPVNSHTYYLLEPAIWTDSEAKAISIGGHLATVRNLVENNWIYNQFSAFSFGGKTSRGLWIGLNDVATENSYKWSSGEPFAYSNWGSSEPTNQDGLDDYVHLLWPGDPRQSKWNDLQNVSNYASIPISGVVEITATPEPSTLLLLFFGSLAVLWRRRALR